MPVVTPAHQALWLKAAPHCSPGPDESPPTYGAVLRTRKRKRLRLDDEAVVAEKPGLLEDGE